MTILSFIVALLIVTGGLILRFDRFQLDLSTVDVWAVTLLFLCFWLYKRNKLNKLNVGPILRRFLVPNFTSREALCFLISICGLIFIGHCFKHWSLHTHGYDMSYVHQPLFYPYADGYWLKTNASILTSLFSEHLAFSFLFLSPLTMFIHSDEWIFFLQVFFIGSSLWMIVTKGPLKKYPEIFLALFLIIFSHRGLRSGMYFDFREDVLTFVGLLGMILALFRGSLILYFGAFILALFAKENVFAVTLFFIFPILFSRSVSFSKSMRYLLAGVTAIASLGYGFIAFKYLIPHFTVLKPEIHPLFIRFGYLGKSAPEIVLNILTSPAVWLKLFLTCFAPIKLKYLLLILGPFLFFYRSREAWVWFLVAVPGILMNICHDYTNQIMLVFHYELILLPGLITALIVGAKAMVENKTQKVSPLFWGLLIALCFSGRWPGYFISSEIPTEAEWRMGRELHSLKENQNVGTNLRLSAQVNYLKDYTLVRFEKNPERTPEEWLQKFSNVETWVVDPSSPQEKQLGEFLEKNNFTLIDKNFEGDPVWIFVRK